MVEQLWPVGICRGRMRGTSSASEQIVLRVLRPMWESLGVSVVGAVVLAEPGISMSLLRRTSGVDMRVFGVVALYCV